ncbi:S100 calcium binding protein U [Mastacembelus armatus]|uniref:S100 calcium binding protein U n=1 Tax=Mastacembelus armatus TaxID=205130 RepID=UPI000E45EA51|nr:uncharacterized protein LOC113126482 [Mastacembelus armatus]
MEAAIQTVVKVFMKSAKGKESLGKKDFQNLVKSQFSNILSDTDSKEAVNNMCQGLDTNQDGRVGFEEYMKLVGYLAVSLNEQRILANEEPATNAATAQVAQSVVTKEEEKPEANAEAKPEATAEVKVDANADGKVEVKAEGETQPQAAKKEPAVAAAAVVASATEAAAVTVVNEVVVKEEKKVGGTEEVVVVAEKVVTTVEAEVEKKTEEATS